MTMVDAPALKLPFVRLESDVPWDAARHVELTPPERITLLEEWGPDAAGPTAHSPVAITSPLRFLSDEGVQALQEICTELAQYGSGVGRIAKKVRGAVYRSSFLRGMASDPTILAFLGEIAQVPLEPHPVHHHAVHINYAPDDLALNVDQWHRDAIAFDYVLMASDPRPMKGGRFEYYAGPMEEGRDLLLAEKELPAGKVKSPEFPGPGWAVLQQGHRVLHRACRLEESYPRITVVNSFWAPVPGVDDPTDLPTILKFDGPEVALTEWSRFQALVGASQLQHFAHTQTDFTRPLPELQAELRRIAGVLEDAADAFDRDDAGSLISYGAGS